MYRIGRRGGDPFRHEHINAVLAQRSAGDQISLLEIKDPKVSFLLYQASHTAIRHHGLSLPDVKTWTKDIANGVIPKGLKTLEEFEQYILNTITSFDKDDSLT